MIDRKLEPLVKRQMTKYLGELEDDDLVMFVLEHLKDHKGPQKLIEGLEPVRLLICILLESLSRPSGQWSCEGMSPNEPAPHAHCFDCIDTSPITSVLNIIVLCLFQVLEEEAVEFTVSIWRQIIFESMAYGEGLHTERIMAD